MENAPLVSVAIITYNQKKFLIEAIESVLAQDYSNIQIVVADDGSTDGTHEILKDYEAKYPGKFVLSLSETNEGVTKNSNKAHFSCIGKYIAWLGGDDLMNNDKISKQVQFLESNPECNIVYHNLEVFNSDTKNIIQLFNNNRNKHTGGVEVLIKYGTFNGACSNMVRSDKTPPHGFDEELKVASDWLYWIEILKDGGRICYIDEVLGKYRKHSNNVSGKDSPLYSQAIQDHFLTIKKTESFAPQFSKQTNYAKSVLYNTTRKLDYQKNLILSLKCNPLNIKSIVYLLTYYFSLKKIKL